MQTLGPVGPSHAEEVEAAVEVSMLLWGGEVLSVLDGSLGLNPALSAWPCNLPLT